MYQYNKILIINENLYLLINWLKLLSFELLLLTKSIFPLLFGILIKSSVTFVSRSLIDLFFILPPSINIEALSRVRLLFLLQFVNVL